MFNMDDVQREVLKRFANGSAVVDMKHNEVFRFTMECDGKCVFQWPDHFRAATENEANILKMSGKSYASLQ